MFGIGFRVPTLNIGTPVHICPNEDTAMTKPVGMLLCNVIVIIYLQKKVTNLITLHHKSFIYWTHNTSRNTYIFDYVVHIYIISLERPWGGIL